MARSCTMRNRILLEPSEMRAGRTITLGPRDPRAVHIRTVLRGSEGLSVRVGVVGGAKGRAEVRAAPPAGDLELQWAETETEVEQSPRLDLLLAMPRPKVMKRLWAQLASLRLGTLYVTGGQKVEKSYFTSGALSPEYVYPQLLRGLEQVGDTSVPGVWLCRDLGRALDSFAGVGGGVAPGVLIQERRCCGGQLPPPSRLLVGHPGGASGGQLEEALEGLEAGERVLVAVGPEGGWAPQELEALSPPRFRRVSLGSRPLSTETACIALPSVLKTLIHDWA